ncbi:MAG TPA: AAA family ATPase [Candidatus Fraserbacteria bacterium]|nr:AAA family ATPase [Candidatus Fraserbacteria bacterium]
MHFDAFTEKAQELFRDASQLLERYKHNQLDVEHLFYVLAEEEGVGRELLTKMNVPLPGLLKDLDRLLSKKPQVSTTVGQQIYITPRLESVVKSAELEAERLKDQFVGVEHLLIAISREPHLELRQLLDKYGISPETVYGALREVRGEQRVTDREAEGRYQILERYSLNLTELARKGQLDPVIGRGRELRRVAQILSRRRKHNPVLIGEPGVGKTAIVEGLAQRIISGDVPETLKDKELISLDIPAMVAGSKFRGEFEERLKATIKEVEADHGHTLVFIDELHNIMGAGGAEGAIDASNILKPPLARGSFQVIGATTLDEYRQRIEKDPALERRFQKVLIGEPSPAETVEILRGLRAKLEEHHRLKISDEALQAATKLSQRYITDRFLPDKAIDLVDEAASKIRVDRTFTPEIEELEGQISGLSERLSALAPARKREKLSEKLTELREQRAKLAREHQARQGQQEVTPADIAEVVSLWTGIPAQRMLEEERAKLAQMEEQLHRRVIDQQEAVRAVSQAVRRSRAGLSDPHRPTGSFLFLGPTGVGKTELSKALAWFLFADQEALLRIDMSEYMEKHTVARLIGAPPGYVGYEEGGQLTEAVRRKPYQVILFDEIEKAHHDVFNLLLQLLDEGRLTDGQGRTVDFKNTLIILTSNIGSELISGHPSLGFEMGNGDKTESLSYAEIKERVLGEVRHTFRPEFINRLDGIIVFKPLSPADLLQIVELKLTELRAKLSEQEIELEITQPAKELLAEQGYDPNYGARPLGRVIRDKLENAIATKLIEGKLSEGDRVTVDALEGTFVISEQAAETVEA